MLDPNPLGDALLQASALVDLMRPFLLVILGIGLTAAVIDVIRRVVD